MLISAQHKSLNPSLLRNFLKSLLKIEKDQIKPKAGRRKEITKIRADINKIESRGHRFIHSTFSISYIHAFLGLPWWLSSKVSTCNTGDERNADSIPGSERSLGIRTGSPLQYFAWKIPWTEEHCKLQSMGLQRVSHD